MRDLDERGREGCRLATGGRGRAPGGGRAQRAQECSPHGRLRPPSTEGGMSAAESLTEGQGPGTAGRMARPFTGRKLVSFKIAPEQHEALRDAARQAQGAKPPLPNASEGASYIVRELIRAWIDAGAKWPGSPPAAPRRRPRAR